MNREDAIDRLQTKIKANRKALTDWRMKFRKNPRHALEWSEGAFSAAAENQVYERVLGWLRSKASDETVREHAFRELQTASSNPHRSTSAPSNLMRDHERATWAELFDPMFGIFGVNHTTPWVAQVISDESHRETNQ
jgi:hypothetical protein